ncbi:MAG: hypothetical protein CL609_13850 [Anaerolineaceae bacterium]|nr:hypothetical protein [Anaerolineaceae bacterium]
MEGVFGASCNISGIGLLTDDSGFTTIGFGSERGSFFGLALNSGFGSNFVSGCSALNLFFAHKYPCCARSLLGFIFSAILRKRILSLGGAKAASINQPSSCMGSF